MSAYPPDPDPRAQAGPSSEPRPPEHAPPGEAHRAGVAAHGELALTPQAFEARLAALGRGHWARQGVAPTAERLAEHRAGAALADLYLTCAADGGDERAWTRLSQEVRPRLEGIAVRRGIGSQAAVALVQDLLGDLTLPPANGAARTLLGTYDGTGNLLSWLAIVLVRRIAGDARKKKPVSLDAETEAGSPPERAYTGRAAPEPGTLVATDELRTRFAGALGRAWEGLSTQERLALVAKHRDGWSQRQVATLLGLGEARVSRIFSGAVEKLRGPLRDAVGLPGSDGVPAEAALAGEIASFLARTGPLPPPTVGGAIPGSAAVGERADRTPP